MQIKWLSKSRTVETFSLECRLLKHKAVEKVLIVTFITYRAKLLNGDWCRQRAFLGNREHDYLILIWQEAKVLTE